jgi:DNA-binding XRE family transcriptional regulator
VTAHPPHPLLDQLAQLQHDVTILREWAGLLDDAMQEFGASLQKYLPSTDAGELLRDSSAWPTERRALALRARTVREKAGLTRTQLARLTQVAESTIRNLERGRHKITPRIRRRLLPHLEQLEQTLSTLRTDSLSTDDAQADDSPTHRS